MVLAKISDFRHLLACPSCHGELATEGHHFRCMSPTCRLSLAPFPTILDLPVLVNPQSSVISLEGLHETVGASPLERSTNPVLRLRRRVLEHIEAPNDVASIQIRHLLELLRKRRLPDPPRVLVIGGGEQGFGMAELYSARDVALIAFDIYASSFTQFIADAHDVPLQDGSVDAVVIQAVLEHVLEPWTVVSEIYRVLRADGLVYSDTPFLYPVHEGPYDFTRFTDSGHRALYKRFTVIDSGSVRGGGTALSWCLDSFVQSLTRSGALGIVARLATFWAPRLDASLERRRSIDCAASVFLLAQKSRVSASPRELVEYYQGAQTPRPPSST